MERVGVFVCHCGSNIGSVVDCAKVAEELRNYPNVVHSVDYKYMCSEPGQNLIKEAVNLDYVGIGKTILGVYVIVVTVYIMAAMVGYGLYYDYSRKKLAKYFRMLRKLRSMYQEEEGLLGMEEMEE